MLTQSVESAVADEVVHALANVTLRRNADVFQAILEESQDAIGDYGVAAERRLRMVVAASDALGLARGDVLNHDPVTAGSPRYVVDAVDARDAHVLVALVREL